MVYEVVWPVVTGLIGGGLALFGWHEFRAIQRGEQTYSQWIRSKPALKYGIPAVLASFVVWFCGHILFGIWP